MTDSPVFIAIGFFVIFAIFIALMITSLNLVVLLIRYLLFPNYNIHTGVYWIANKLAADGKIHPLKILIGN